MIRQTLRAIEDAGLIMEVPVNLNLVIGLNRVSSVAQNFLFTFNAVQLHKIEPNKLKKLELLIA